MDHDLGFRVYRDKRWFRVLGMKNDSGSFRVGQMMVGYRDE